MEDFFVFHGFVPVTVIVRCTLRDASRACELVITIMMMVIVQGISIF